jgi:competence protein ComEA
VIRRLVLAALLLAALPALAAKKSLPASERIDLNRAPVTELMRLPGVGQRKAQAIVAHRQRAPFRRAEDLLQVKGFGPGWLEKSRGNVTVGGPPPASPAAPTGAR